MESGIANTLNTFDVGDVRSTTIVVSYEDIDNIHGRRRGGDGMELRRDSRNTESDIGATIRTPCGGDSTKANVVVSNLDGSGTSPTLTANNANGSQRMPDKDNFNAVIGGGTEFAIVGDHENRPTDMTNVIVYERNLCAIENHPNDSRVKINESGIVQTLSGVMGTGGGNVPLVMRQHFVRRLTPLECERLQGFPDGWTDIGEWTDTKGKAHKPSDSARYKALGNSIALSCWFWLLRRISAQYERPATMASLFDGIGGFPLCWEKCNGKGTAIWASEIEEFPIAVTKMRFPDEE